MKMRQLGSLHVSAIGLGCMGFSHGYGEIPSEEESIRLIRQAYEQYGCNLFDTAEIYATYENEILVGKALEPIRDKIVLTSKFMPVALPGQDENKLSRKGVRDALEASLKRLRTDYLDLYYEHRVPTDSDPAEIAYWMGELIAEGKIRAWGMSEPTEAQLRAAHAVTPLACIQNEFSMMQRRSEPQMFAVCQELGIGFEAYSPMAGGFLSGKYSADTEFKGDDVRRVITRFSKENMRANQPVLDLLHDFAAQKNATPAQITLAWVLAKGDFIVPLCGMRSDTRMAENFGALDIGLSVQEMQTLDQALANLTVYGDRKDSDIKKLGTVDTLEIV